MGLPGHRPEKTYLALLCGAPGEDFVTIDAPLTRDGEGDDHRRLVRSGGLPAVTHCRILLRAERFSLAALRLETGRTHQIRAHMAWLGCPLAGDALYGGDCGPITRQALHCWRMFLTGPAGQTASLPELMDMDVNTAIDFCRNMKTVCQKLKVLQQLGLGYLTLGEETPSLSGGEAQRLKLASEIGRTQTDSVFVFDEPSIGLHPLDVQVLLGVFQALLDNGATVVVIEHDLDVIRNADYIIDMGPGGGDAGGRIVACGTPEQICNDPASITGRYLRR